MSSRIIGPQEPHAPVDEKIIELPDKVIPILFPAARVTEPVRPLIKLIIFGALIFPENDAPEELIPSFALINPLKVAPEELIPAFAVSNPPNDDAGPLKPPEKPIDDKTVPETVVQFVRVRKS